MRSVAPASEAVSIAHSFGQGTSTALSVWAFEASDTVTPSLTKAAAALRLPGVIRLSVPISSSFPHRPQFESSARQRSYSAWVTSVPGATRAAGALGSSGWTATAPHDHRHQSGYH